MCCIIPDGCKKYEIKREKLVYLKSIITFACESENGA